MSQAPGEPYDLSVSHAHADNEGEHAWKVSALVEANNAEYQRMAGTPPRVFFDRSDIHGMNCFGKQMASETIIGNILR